MRAVRTGPRVIPFILTFILISIITLMLCCGCTQQPSESDQTLIIYMNCADTSRLNGLALVNDQLDSYVYDKLGVHVKLVMPPNYTQSLNTALSNGEQIDIAYCATLSDIRTLWKNHSLHAIDDLLETHGQRVLQEVSTSYISASKLDGAYYAVPTNRDHHQIVGLEYNQEIADKYALDLSQVHAEEDLTTVFQVLKEQAPEISPVVIAPGFLHYNNTDMLGDAYGVLTEETGTTVINLYETEMFEQQIKLFHTWQENGYMLNHSREEGLITYYMGSGQVFGSLTFGKVGFEAQESKLCGLRIGFLPLGDAYCPTDIQERCWYTIPSTSADPEKAMELLSLLYTDSYAANLIMYGIEGVHYELIDPTNHIVRQIQSADTESYCGLTGFNYCNQYIAAIPEGYDPDIWEQTELVNRTASKSPAWGFQFDNTPVAEQVYRCDRVKAQYLNVLYAGIADPEETLAAFQSALKGAGIDEIIAEKQRQLDAYLQDKTG